MGIKASMLLFAYTQWGKLGPALTHDAADTRAPTPLSHSFLNTPLSRVTDGQCCKSNIWHDLTDRISRENRTQTRQ